MQWPQQVGGTRPGQHIQGQQAVPQKNAAPKQWAGQAGSPAFTKPQPGGHGYLTWVQTVSVH